MKPRFFRSATDLRRWLDQYSANAEELSAPSYRRAAIWWVISARQEATRRRRLIQAPR